MFCCSNCFIDPEIKGIIEGNRQTNNCDFCGSKNAYVYEIGTDQTLADRFEDLLNVYSPISDLPDNFPPEHYNLMKHILSENWQIFNLKQEKIYKLITKICSDRYRMQPDLFDKPVGIRQHQDSDYLEENSILKNNQWTDFVDNIKRNNRFHSDFINKDKLHLFLKCTVKTRHKGEILYRSRICPDSKGFSPENMGAPQGDKIKEGRVNPAGIRVLYLSDSLETTLHEIRARVHDYITVGHFELQKNIEVIDLANIAHISPFIATDHGIDHTQYALNIEHLKTISHEIAQPLHNGSTLDYLPTQYISDYIRSKGYNAIEYASTMNKTGTNLAIFEPELFECTETDIRTIDNISHISVKK